MMEVTNVTLTPVLFCNSVCIYCKNIFLTECSLVFKAARDLKQNRDKNVDVKVFLNRFHGIGYQSILNPQVSVPEVEKKPGSVPPESTPGHAPFSLHLQCSFCQLKSQLKVVYCAELLFSYKNYINSSFLYFFHFPIRIPKPLKLRIPETSSFVPIGS